MQTDAVCGGKEMKMTAASWGLGGFHRLDEDQHAHYIRCHPVAARARVDLCIAWLPYRNCVR
jgi:hypothetical protein